MNESNSSWFVRLTAGGAIQNEALAELRELLFFRLRRTFQGRTGVDDALLEDITQESLLKTLDHLEQFQGKSRFTTWATTIAVRVAVTELRRRHWKDVSLEQLMDQSSTSGLIAGKPGPPPEVYAEKRALIDDMHRLIETDLTEKQRMALLAELGGMPLEEIGRRMGSNRNAIYKLTHDARKRLKQGLESAGYSMADLRMV
jgi:RNA polymerase sigma-70 factor (ECF subfamily)